MRVMSLRDGLKKMSKSDESDYSRLNMTDDRDAIALKFQKAKSDPLPLPTTDAEMEGRPEAINLINIYAALTDKSHAEVLADISGLQFSAFKAKLTEVAVNVLGPINAETKRLMNDPAEIDRVLARGAEKANTIAAGVLKEVYDVVGFLPRA